MNEALISKWQRTEVRRRYRLARRSGLSTSGARYIAEEVRRHLASTWS